MVNHLPANAEDMGLIPDLGRSHRPQSNTAPGLQQEKLPRGRPVHTTREAERSKDDLAQQKEKRKKSWMDA